MDYSMLSASCGSSPALKLAVQWWAFTYLVHYFWTPLQHSYFKRMRYEIGNDNPCPC